MENVCERQVQGKKIDGVYRDLDELFVQYDRLPYYVARRYRSLGKVRGLDYEDLASVASIGMIKAYNQFDSDRYNVRFTTYAVPLMSYEILRYLRNEGEVLKFPKHAKENGYRLIKQGLTHSTVSDIQKKVDLTESEILAAKDYLTYRTVLSSDVPLSNQSEDSEKIILMDKFYHEDDFSLMDFHQFFDLLTPREQLILTKVSLGESQRVIGQSTGIGQVQVSRILARLHREYHEYKEGTFDVSKRKKSTGNKLEPKRTSELTKAMVIIKEGTDLSLSEICDVTGANYGSLKSYYYRKRKKENLPPVGKEADARKRKKQKTDQERHPNPNK